MKKAGERRNDALSGPMQQNDLVAWKLWSNLCFMGCEIQQVQSCFPVFTWDSQQLWSCCWSCLLSLIKLLSTRTRWTSQTSFAVKIKWSHNLNGNADDGLGFKYSQYHCCHSSVEVCRPRQTDRQTGRTQSCKRTWHFFFLIISNWVYNFLIVH